MYQSLVVEASVIYHFFSKNGIIGKGKDPILGVSSSIYRLQATNQNKQEEFGKYALQIFENLSQEQYDLKASQISKAMTLHITPFTTRIIMLGRDQLHPTQINLHVVYEYENVSDQCLWKNTEPYDLQNAKQLLQLFCQNYMLQARFTNEFLDISPQNIFTTQDGQYIITNFALNYAGTKFHRNYIPTTDPLMKEKKISQTNILYSYAFKAGLITFCQMTQIDSKDLFFEDGQFKEQLLENILALLHEKPIQKDKRLIQTIPQLFDNLTFTKEQDFLEQKRNCKEKQFTYKKSERILKHKYPKEFLDVIRKLLGVNNIQSRAIFPLLVSEDNILQVPNPYFEKQEDKFNFVQGLGENEENLECGLVSKSINENNSITIDQVIYCREIQNKITTKDNQTIITLFGLQNNQEWKYYENQMLYFSKQLMAPIHLIQKSKKETIFLFEGESQFCYLLNGKSYQNDYSIFEGEFRNNLPFKGKLTYQNKDYFEGEMDGFNKKKGIFWSQGKEFDGEFVNDSFVKGLINYDDGGIFFGNVKNGEKFGAGIYKYPYSDIEYHGLYSNDLRHGMGTFFDKSVEGMFQDVQYNYGECQTKLNEHFIKALKEINQKIKENKQQQQALKQQQENGEIQEDIEKNPEDDNEEDVEIVQD